MRHPYEDPVNFYVYGQDSILLLCITYASRESVRRWFHRFSRIFSVGKGFRRAVALDETVVKLHGLRAYVWSAVDIDYCYEVHQDGLG